MVEQQLGDRPRGKIQDDKTHDVSYYAQSFSVADYGTTHVAVLARNRDAVSVTTTINYRLVSDQSQPSASVKRKKAWVQKWPEIWFLETFILLQFQIMRARRKTVPDLSLAWPCCRPIFSTLRSL